MGKIPKELSDKAMFAGYTEPETFETMFLAAEAEEQPAAKPKKKSAGENLQLAYLTAELQEKLGKALLDLKMELYKEGIVDYDIKVKRDGKNIVLVPSVGKAKTNK